MKKSFTILVVLISLFIAACCKDDSTKTCKEDYELAVSNKTCALAEENIEIFKVVEESPLFPGCDTVLDSAARRTCAEEKLFAFIKDNLVYPPSAIELGLEGKVYIKFAVEKDGCVDGIEIVRAIGCGCEQEAIRLAELMPQWAPGKQRGNPVRVQYNLPIEFKL